MNILAIETSCDETALSVVKASGGLTRPQFVVLQNIISSQIKLHAPFGGVVPNIAKREHIANLPKLFKQLGLSADLKEIDAIAVTVGPGLAPALWAGIEFAKEIAAKFDKPLLGANHLEGHMYSTLLPSTAIQIQNKKLKVKASGVKEKKMSFPAVGLLVSGGHTILLSLSSLTKRTKLGETVDDAAGEAFDKVAKMMQLPYPGGPQIEKLAKSGNPAAIAFPRPMLNSGDYEFSFSGLKTAVLYYLRDNLPASGGPEKFKADVAASFQEAATDVLVKKAVRAMREVGARSVFLCGGVAANSYLRNKLEKVAEGEGANFIVPEFVFNTDNAVMIAAAAYMNHLTKKKYKIEAQPNLNL